MLASVRVLTRVQTLLAAVVTLAGLWGAFAKPLELQWLQVASGTVAAVGGTALAIIIWRQYLLMGRDELDESARRLQVEATRVSEVDPTRIGVDPAAQTSLGDAALPEYLPREVDAELREAVEAARRGRGAWLVVVRGRSKVGKSRALFEALRACDSWTDPLHLVAPVDGAALESLLRRGEDALPPEKPAALWLDDLEPFLNQGVTWKVLSEWWARGPSRFVVATYGGKGSERIGGSTVGEVTALVDELLPHAHEITLAPTTSDELEPLRDRLSEAEFDMLRQHGLAAYLVAGPRLQRKLDTARHSVGQPECQQGVAVVNAAIDWARCGRTDPITDEILRKLWPTYIVTGSAGTDDEFSSGLDWALRPVAATIALLQRSAGGYRAYDLVVQLRRDQLVAVAPQDAVWATAIETASPTQAFAVGSEATWDSSLDRAIDAFTCAMASPVSELAARAGTNLGVVLSQSGRSVDSIAAYQQVVDRHGDDQDPGVHEHVASALYLMGMEEHMIDRQAEAVAAWERVVERYGDDDAAMLRELVAMALVGQGMVLNRLNRPKDAERAFRQVVDRSGDDPQSAVRVQVAFAMENLGVIQCFLGRPADAVNTFQEIVDRYGDYSEPAVLERVTKALYRQACVLSFELDRQADAAYRLRQVLERCGNNPALRDLAEEATTLLDSLARNRPP